MACLVFNSTTARGLWIKFNSNLYLEIKIGANAPLTPRQPLASVACWIPGSAWVMFTRV